MKPYLTSIITAVTLACSSAAQRPIDQFSEQTATNPRSYQSLTEVQRDECTALFISSEKDPTKITST